MKEEILFLKQYLQENKISYIKVSEMSGVPLNTLKGIFSGKTKNPRIETIVKISRAIGIYKGSSLIDDEEYITYYNSLSEQDKILLNETIILFDSLSAEKKEIAFNLIQATLKSLNDNKN